MKHLMKVSLMALDAMFAFNTTADAQLGGLLKKAKSAVGGGKKQEPSAVQQAMNTVANYEEKKSAGEPMQIKSWKTGEMMTVYKTELYQGGSTTSAVYADEKNFRDKAMKKNIIEQLLDDEKFNNKKRSAEDEMKDRKIVAVVFTDNDWQVHRNNVGAITQRFMYLEVVSELTSGAVVKETYYVGSNYGGAGSYSETLNFNVFEYKSGYNKYYKRWYVKDWEHKEGADPLADL